MRKFGTFIVAFVLLATMFLPMVAIHMFSVGVELGKEAPGEITVGLVVILRATFRRLLRGFSTNILQTTIGAFGRTSARAVTRRFVKFAGRVLFGSILQDSIDATVANARKAPQKPGFWKQLSSLILGFVGLCLSFWGILYVIPPEHAQAIVGSKGLSEFEVAVMAGLPLLFYALLHKIFGKIFHVHTSYATAIDGLLLQGYFTGAGSFLPLTTDVEYKGERKDECKLAVSSLLGMLGFFGIFYVLGVTLDRADLQFFGSMFLVYCFVYSFPIKPLEGHFIWSFNKLVWLLVMLPILISFMTCMDYAFGEIL